VIIDSGILYALYDAKDEWHERAKNLVVEAHSRREQFVIPAPVFVEIDYLASGRHGMQNLTSKVLEDVARGAYRVAELTLFEYRRVAVLIEQYADADLGFVDAAVVAIAERLNERVIATTDRRDFSIVRPLHVTAFELVP